MPSDVQPIAFACVTTVRLKPDTTYEGLCTKRHAERFGQVNGAAAGELSNLFLTAEPVRHDQRIGGEPRVSLAPRRSALERVLHAEPRARRVRADGARLTVGGVNSLTGHLFEWSSAEAALASSTD